MYLPLCFLSHAFSIPSFAPVGTSFWIFLSRSFYPSISFLSKATYPSWASLKCIPLCAQLKKKKVLYDIPLPQKVRRDECK